MKVWKDKSGKWITPQEFGERFKKGVEGVTPLQQVKTNLIGYFIIVIGVIIGLIASFSNKQWWLFIILIGSSFITGTSFLAQIQRFISLNNIEKMVKMNDLPLTDEVQNEN